jgi:two-component system, chemotaxis family, response regulator Rcp1
VPLLPTILLVGADPDERAMLRDALLEGSGPVDVRSVDDVEQLDRYLESEGSLASPAPSLVLVVLEHAAEAVERLKSDPARRRVPVVALTRAKDPQAIARAYDAGANTVLPKPVTFLALVRLMKVFTAYWLEAATLPAREAA